jgi:DNA-binding beta-propeller fold protein YncE
MAAAWGKHGVLSVGVGLAMVAVTAGALAQEKKDVLNLPSSKQILGSVPGNPQRLNSEPISMAVSPDGRYVVTVNAGYGTSESDYLQSLAVMNTQTGKLVDFPDDRTASTGKETLYSGLAFSADGKHLYASMASLTMPTGDGAKNPGNGVVVYGFNEGKITQERVIPIGLQPLAGNRRTSLGEGKDPAKGIPFPAAIAVAGPVRLHTGGVATNPAPGGGTGEWLLVADDLSDDVLMLDTVTGRVQHRFDLSESDAVPGTYPVGLAVSKDGERAFVALWNASEIVELNLWDGTLPRVGRKLALLKPSDPLKPGTHPSALEISPDGKTLYVALSNRDAVASVDISGTGPASKFDLKGYFDTRLPGQSYFGAEPDTLALNADGTRLYTGNMGSDAVAVIDTGKLTSKAAKEGMVEPIGFVPTEWMPMSMALSGGKLYVATAKGKGTGPNNFPQKVSAMSRRRGDSTYVATLLYGSLAVLDPSAMERDLPKWTAEVMESNRMKAAEEKIAFAGGTNPIKHVVYIIKENRTYDQVFGDLKQNGKQVGNGDPRLAMYGESTTPNQHKLALQFGVLDNFFDSGEVSGDGHVWSNAAIGTDYLEKTWEQNYRNGQRTYDYEGVVSQNYPLQQKIADVNEPMSGYMWGNVDAHGKTHYNFGEYISSTFCDAKKSGSSQEGPVLEGSPCAVPSIAPGAAIPAEWGGGTNKFAWAIPRLARNTPTKPELVGHYAPETPDFNVRVPDQIRANVFLNHFAGWVADRAAGKDTMPNYITVRLGDDHTGGTAPGGPTPKASVADNDLAIGRMVEAISHSPYWDDTAFFILEDDAQNGADHVDAHRSLALVISKYAPHAADGAAYVDSRFYSTVSVIRTMETLLGLPPMNNNDALSSMIGTLFTGPGDQAPFTLDTTNRDNNLIYTANTRNAVGAAASLKMDFTHADRADPQKLNVILWRDAMGEAPIPAQILAKPKKIKKDDDD